VLKASMTTEKKCNGESVGKMTAFYKLPVGKWEPFYGMVQQNRPLVVNVDATPWFSYGGGVLNCPVDAFTPGHKVLLVGYGKNENQEGYFWIRNSWGRNWGEGGYVRLGSSLSAAEENNCGTPTDPTLGSYCPYKDGEQTEKKPPRLCGACGLLS